MPSKNGRKQTARRRVSFKLRAPEAHKVQLAGTFNGWDPEARTMRCDAKGIWKTNMLLAPGKYEFRFLVDGEWQNDPTESETPNPFGSRNNQITVM